MIDQQFYDLLQKINAKDGPVEVVLSHINNTEFIELLDAVKETSLNDDFKVGMAAIFSGYTISVKEVTMQQFVDYTSACMYSFTNYKIKLKTQIFAEQSEKILKIQKHGEIEVLRSKVVELQKHVVSLRNTKITNNQNRRAGDQLQILSILNSLLLKTPLSNISVYSHPLQEYTFEWKMNNTGFNFSSKLYPDEIYTIETLVFLLSHINGDNMLILTRIFDACGPFFAKFSDRCHLLSSNLIVSSLKRSLRRNISRKRRKSITTMSSFTLSRSGSEISLASMNYHGNSKFLYSYVAVFVKFFLSYKNELMQQDDNFQRKMFRFMLYFLASINLDVLENCGTDKILSFSDLSVVYELLHHSARDESIFKKMMLTESPMISAEIMHNLYQLELHIKRHNSNNLILVHEFNFDTLYDFYQPIACEHIEQLVSYDFSVFHPELQNYFVFEIEHRLEGLFQHIQESMPEAYFMPLFSLLHTGDIQYFITHHKIMKYHHNLWIDPKLFLTILVMIFEPLRSPVFGQALVLLQFYHYCAPTTVNFDKIADIFDLDCDPLIFAILMQLFQKLFLLKRKQKVFLYELLKQAIKYKHASIDISPITQIYENHAPELLVDIQKFPKHTLDHLIETISIAFVHCDKSQLEELLDICNDLLWDHPTIASFIFQLFDKFPKQVYRYYVNYGKNSNAAFILFHYRNYLNTKQKLLKNQLLFIPIELGTMQEIMYPNYLQVLKQEYMQLNTEIVEDPDETFRHLKSMPTISTQNKPMPHFLGLLFLRLNNPIVLEFICRDDPFFIIKVAFMEIENSNICFLLNKLILIDTVAMNQLCTILLNYIVGYLRKLKAPPLSVLMPMCELLTNCLKYGNAINLKDLIKNKVVHYLIPSNEQPYTDMDNEHNYICFNSCQNLNIFYLKHHQPLQLIPCVKEFETTYYSSFLLANLHSTYMHSLLPLLLSQDLNIIRNTTGFLLFLFQKQPSLLDEVMLQQICTQLLLLEIKNDLIKQYSYYFIYHVYQIHSDYFIFACISSSCAQIHQPMIKREDMPDIHPINVFLENVIDALKFNHQQFVIENINNLLENFRTSHFIQIEPLQQDVIKDAFTLNMLTKLLVNLICEFNFKSPQLMGMYNIVCQNFEDECCQQGFAQVMHLMAKNIKKIYFRESQQSRELIEFAFQNQWLHLSILADVLAILKVYLKYAPVIKLGEFEIQMKEFHNIHYTDNDITSIFTAMVESKNPSVIEVLFRLCKNLKCDSSSFEPIYKGIIEKQNHLLWVLKIISPENVVKQMDITPSYQSLIEVLFPLGYTHGNIEFMKLLSNFFSPLLGHQLLVIYKTSNVKLNSVEFEKYYLLLLLICVQKSLASPSNCTFFTILFNELISKSDHYDILELGKQYVKLSAANYSQTLFIHEIKQSKMNRALVLAARFKKAYQSSKIIGRRGLTVYDCQMTIDQVNEELSDFILKEFKQESIQIPAFLKEDA
eukprot:NODE_36_length_36011_cov_1.012920.p1 type:complete len:1466 gc:universal NODE_36_length_36011_cov_1.012920:19644-24041(+)